MDGFIWSVGDLIEDYDGDIGIVLRLIISCGEHPDERPVKTVLVQWLDDGDWEPPYLESYRVLLRDCKLLEVE